MDVFVFSHVYHCLPPEIMRQSQEAKNQLSVDVVLLRCADPGGNGSEAPICSDSCQIYLTNMCETKMILAASEIMFPQNSGIEICEGFPKTTCFFFNCGLEVFYGKTMENMDHLGPGNDSQRLVPLAPVAPHV